MKTENLIQALSADLATRPTPVPRAVFQALWAGVPIALGILIFALEVRPDIWTVIANPRFLFKFMFSLSALAAGLWLVLRLSRPGTPAGPALGMLAVSAGLLLLAVGTELVVLPSGNWLPALMGDRALACMVLIPTLAAAPLAALLYTLKAGAPDSPQLAGAAAGLLAGAIGATLYASHCTNDSPLFVATWYVIGISAVTVIGWLIGGRVLRW